MAKVIIIYGSTGGNTQSVSERIGNKLTELGHEVSVKNVIDSSVEDLTQHDVLLMGSSTWNDGELQDDFVGMHMDMEEQKPDLSTKKYAAFGCGESIYEYFCGAVDILDKTMTELGAQKLAAGLKIDGYPEEDDNVDKINKWVDEVSSKL